MTAPAPEPPIYTPETPDALRDGLYRGWHAHQRSTTTVNSAASDVRHSRPQTAGNPSAALGERPAPHTRLEQKR